MYSVLVELVRPSVLLFLLAGLTLLVQWRKGVFDRGRLFVVGLPLFLLLLCYIPAVGYLALGSLEWRYAAVAQRPRDIDGIVVLGGYVRPVDKAGTIVEPGEDTLFRCLKAAELYRQGKPCPILVSGGKVDPEAPGPSCAAEMRDVLVSMGARPGDLILEEQSRSTYENAVECSRLLRERRLSQVLLVTDAAHLRRAAACFRKQGVEVTPCGCRFRATYLEGFRSFVPSSGTPEDVDDAWHEWVGLAYYAATGKI
jgi:uncharacterized SAM-binding protein YcdF (DUF218 family)